MQLDLLEKEARADAKKSTAISKKSAPMKSVATSPTAAEEDKAPSAFKTISEVAAALDVPQHVLRFWESRFAQIKPLKLRGGRRYYRPEDIEVLSTIKQLLYKQGYTIKGAKKAISQGGREKPEAVPQPAAAALAKAKPVLSERQHNQLAVVKQELLGMREVLKPYVAD